MNDATSPIDLRWVSGRNFGDALSPYLVSAITGVPPRHVEYAGRYLFFLRRRRRRPVYAVVGSIIAQATRWRNVVIWGAGFKSGRERVWFRPARVCAVRGPLSRAKLEDAGVECPAVYGDPALLLPRFLAPGTEKTHALGVIPHFADRALPAVRALEESGEVRVIDVRGDVPAVVESICACERVVSNSLHGLIVADAYGIPARWVAFSDRVGGHGFKFMDYFLSVARPYQEPALVGESGGAKEVLRRPAPYHIEIDLDRLWDACPFRPGAP